MTLSPKEEAKELVEKLASPLDVFKININSKRCGLITVDAILKVAFYASDEIYNHYLEVKKEIELLWV